MRVIVSDKDQPVLDRQLGAFSAVDKTDANDFIERLDEMHALDVFRAYKKFTFDLMNIASGARVADVGCGTGEDVSSLADLVGPSGQAIGLDLSSAMIAEAQKRHADKGNVSFLQASSEGLGLPDNELDAIRADRVLIHVQNPEATLAEFIRVTRPGGRIVLSEPDMHGFWVASDDYGTTRLLVNEIANSCVMPYLPRDLWTMMRDHGLKDVRCSIQTLTSSDIKAVSKVLDLSLVVKMAVSGGLVSEERAAKWGDDLKARAENDRFAAALSIVVVSGTKA